MVQIFPIGLRLQGKPCLVIGSSEEAEPRVRALLDAGAQVRWVTGVASGWSATERGSAAAAAPPGASPTHALELCSREFQLTDLDERWLVVLADRDPELAPQLAASCDARRIFFCAIDQPEGCSFYHMALVRSGQVTVAISTAGTAPALGRRLRQELARLFDEARLGDFAVQIAKLRERLEPAARKATLNALLREVALTGKLSLPEV